MNPRKTPPNRYHVAINISLDPRLREQAVALAEERGMRGLSALVSDLLREELEKAKIAAAIAAAVASNPSTPPLKDRKGRGKQSEQG